MEEELVKKRKESRKKFVLDGLLALIALWLGHVIKFGHLDLEEIYWKFIPIYMLCWFISSFLSRKFKARWRKRRNRRVSANRLGRVKPYFVSILFFGALLSLFLNNAAWNDLSRTIVFGALAIYFTLEVLILTGIFFKDVKRKEEHHLRREFSIVFFLLELFLVILGSLGFRFVKLGAANVTEEHTVALSVIYFLWVFTGLMVHHFNPPRDRNYLRAAWPFMKSQFFTLCTASFLVFALRVSEFSGFIFGTLSMLVLFEMLVVTALYLHRKPKENDTREMSLVQYAPPAKEQAIREVIEKEKTDSKEYLIPDQEFRESRFLRKKLQDRYLRRYPKIFNFLDHVMDLGTIDILNAEVLDSGNPYNIEIIEDDSLEFLLNLHQLNTFGKLDEYLIDVNQRLKGNGFFVSKFQPSEYRRRYFQRKYPFFLANGLYVLDVIWRQVFPKLPLLRKLYFALSRGRNRVISMAEGFGRLYFCGFEIVSLEEMDDYLFFIVKKSEDPYIWFRYYHTFNRVPNYGLLFKQKRVGKGKDFIHIYKLQTMHPYSEFIHKFVLELNNLDAGGKIKDDFRITKWGRIFRRLWVDELPMIFNLLKGDLKLVGVRPLSQTFFDTYPEELQDERTKYKPGLVPPFYADLPQTMEEILESERRYLEKYKDAPLKTDFIYFWKAFKNIVFKGAKSG